MLDRVGLILVSSSVRVYRGLRLESNNCRAVALFFLDIAEEFLHLSACIAASLPAWSRLPYLAVAALWPSLVWTSQFLCRILRCLSRFSVDLSSSMSCSRPIDIDCRSYLPQVDQVYGKPRLTHHSFRLRPREYFYPASLVKLPTALLALEKLHDLPAKQEITMNTPYQVLETSCEKASGQTETNRRFTIRDDVMGSLVISDNPAFDRLLFLDRTGVSHGNPAPAGVTPRSRSLTGLVRAARS
jgi:hypothetical protein